MKKPENDRKEVKENLFTLPTKESSFIGFNFLDCLFKTIKQTDYYSLPGQVVPKYNEFTVEVIFLMKETEVIVSKKRILYGY